MRIALIADIHGNLTALEAVLDDLRPLHPNLLVVAGDMVNGPQPQAVLDTLLAEDAVMLRGNHENYTLDLARDPKRNGRSKQWQAMRWSFHGLREGTLDLLRDLPEQRVIAGNGTHPVRVVHGSPASDRETLIPDRDPDIADTFRRAGLLAWGSDPKPLVRALAGVRQPVMVCAHSHLQWQQQEGGCLVLNPGSAGMTTDGDPRAAYAILEWCAGNGTSGGKITAATRSGPARGPRPASSTPASGPSRDSFFPLSKSTRSWKATGDLIIIDYPYRFSHGCGRPYLSADEGSKVSIFLPGPGAGP